MKLSEITAETAAEYLRLDYASLTLAELNELEAFIAAAKSYIKGYAGLEDVAPVGEAVGTGDGETTSWTLAYYPSSGQTIYADGSELTETTDYTIDDATSEITFVEAPAYGVAITADYSAVPTDAFPDLAIAAYVLISDMYDNRGFAAEHGANRTVDAILGMHAKNLL